VGPGREHQLTGGLKMKNFKKVVRIGFRSDSGSTYCQINYTDGKLSISGVEGPLRTGNCRGSCGQIIMGINDEYLNTLKFAPGWDLDTAKKFLMIWDKWHLNDMRAGCKHQRAENWEDERIPKNEYSGYAGQDERGYLAIGITESEHPRGLLSKACPTCGYHYGSAWLLEPVPESVLEFLISLPNSDKKPAWV
jgi:hypothetical protein